MPDLQLLRSFMMAGAISNVAGKCSFHNITSGDEFDVRKGLHTRRHLLMNDKGMADRTSLMKQG
jgi:hypothetical protein